MSKRKRILKFPKAPSGYWFLYWIGRIVYDKIKKIEFYFVNKNTANDSLKDFNFNNVYIHILPVSDLVEYKIGTIYSVLDQNIIDYKLTKFGLISNLYIGTDLKQTSKELPLLGYKSFPQIKNILDSELFFMKYNYRQKSVLVTPYCLAQYFFFKSDKLINLILSGSLLDCFDFNKIKFLKDQTNNRVIAELPFDQVKLGNENAKIIAPYLFMKNDLGIKMIMSLYSNINCSLIQARINKKKLESYLKMDFNPSGYKLGLDGMSFYPNGDDSKNKEVFLAYSIKYLQFNNPKIFNVDQIYLIPYNSKESTEDRNNLDKNEVSRIEKPDTTTSIILHNDSVNRSNLLEEATIEDNTQPPFNITVELINREKQDQAYRVVPIPFDKDIEGLVRGLEDFCKDSTLIQESIRKEMIYQESIDKFQYFDEVINVLRNEFNVSINRDPLNIGITAYPIEIKYNEHSLRMDLVELKYNYTSSYIIEFGRGFIGFFNQRNNQKMRHDELRLLIHEFIEEDKNWEKNKILWSAISKKSGYYLQYYSIVIHSGVKHTKEEKISKINKNQNHIYYDTAKRIYERILKTIP